MQNCHKTHSATLGWIDLGLLLVVSIWGVNAVVIKLVYLQVSPQAFGALRFCIPAVLFALILLSTDRSFVVSRRDWVWLALAGLVGTAIYQPFFLYGLKYTHASNASLIIATTPAIVAILSQLIGREFLAPRGWVGIAIAFGGIALIVGGGGDLTFDSSLLLGDALILVSNFLWAAYVLIAAPLMQRHPPLRVTALSTILGAIPLTLAGVPDLSAQDWSRVNAGGWAGILFSSVLGVVVTFTIWNFGVRKLGGPRTAVYQNLTPVIATITAAFCLGEAITPIKVIGMLVVLSGVQLVRTAKLTSPVAPILPVGPTEGTAAP